MSQQHNEIQRYTDLIAGIEAAFGYEGEDGVSRLGETIVPIMNPWQLIEWALLRGEIWWTLDNFQAAVAGELGIVGAGLPVASPYLLVIDGITASAAGFVEIEQVSRATIAATAVQGNICVNRDQRAQTNKALQILFLNQIETWSGTDPGTIGTAQEEIEPTAADFRTFQSTPYLIKPGGVLVVQCEVANVSMRVNMWGRLRPALRTEVR